MSNDSKISDDFLKKVLEYLKKVLKDPSPTTGTSDHVHIQSSYTSSVYLGMRTGQGFASMPYTVQPQDLIEWNFVYDPTPGPGTYGVFVSDVPGDYYWHYDAAQDEITIEQHYGDPSFANDPANIFQLVGAFPPFTIHPYTALSKFVEYNPTATNSYLPVISTTSQYTSFSITNIPPTGQGIKKSTPLKRSFNKELMFVVAAAICAVGLVYLYKQ